LKHPDKLRFKSENSVFSMNAPQLIVFEGVDAAGKSTVCDSYISALADHGVTVRLLSFPGKEPGTLGDLVYQVHHVPESKGVVRHPTEASLQALHIAAHLDAIESVIVPSLVAGETVVLDRYWWSTWVYGVVGGADPDVIGALIEAERLAWREWQPGLVFHVTRTTPLREEPPVKWQKLCLEYDALAAREADRYPVCVLSNDGKLEDTVKNALAKSHGL
jgi:dTMP kinase